MKLIINGERESNSPPALFKEKKKKKKFLSFSIKDQDSEQKKISPSLLFSWVFITIFTDLRAKLLLKNEVKDQQTLINPFFPLPWPVKLGFQSAIARFGWKDKRSYFDFNFYFIFLFLFYYAPDPSSRVRFMAITLYL